MKTQEDFNKYVIEEMSKLIYRIQLLENDIKELKKQSVNYEYWFSEFRKDMEG